MCSVLFVAFFSIPIPYFKTVSLLTFICASITDAIDGWIARKYRMETSFGQLFDPIADKLLVCAAFIIILKIDFLDIPAWMVVAIISREFVITGLRLFAMSKNVLLPAASWGKHKTISQLATIVIILACLSAKEIITRHYPLWNTEWEIHIRTISWCCMSITTILTLYSGLMYLLANRALFVDDKNL